MPKASAAELKGWREHFIEVHEISEDGKRTSVFHCQWGKCEFKNSNTSDCIRHLMIPSHANIKANICNWPGCESAFTQKNHLTTHMNSVHLGLKPCLCIYHGCDAAFSDPAKRTRHYYSAHAYVATPRQGKKASKSKQKSKSHSPSASTSVHSTGVPPEAAGPPPATQFARSVWSQYTPPPTPPTAISIRGESYNTHTAEPAAPAPVAYTELHPPTQDCTYVGQDDPNVVCAAPPGAQVDTYASAFPAPAPLPYPLSPPKSPEEYEWQQYRGPQGQVSIENEYQAPRVQGQAYESEYAQVRAQGPYVDERGLDSRQQGPPAQGFDYAAVQHQTEPVQTNHRGYAYNTSPGGMFAPDATAATVAASAHGMHPTHLYGTSGIGYAYPPAVQFETLLGAAGLPHHSATKLEAVPEQQQHQQPFAVPCTEETMMFQPGLYPQAYTLGATLEPPTQAYTLGNTLEPLAAGPSHWYAPPVSASSCGGTGPSGYGTFDATPELAPAHDQSYQYYANNMSAPAPTGEQAYYYAPYPANNINMSPGLGAAIASVNYPAGY